MIRPPRIPVRQQWFPIHAIPSGRTENNGSTPSLTASAGRNYARMNRSALPHRTEEYETANGPADYAFHIDGKALGIVEAKKLTIGPQNVLTQAERYSQGAAANPFNFDGYRVPFLYSTNGEVIWFRDARHRLNRSRKVADFHTPGALAEFMGRDLDAALDKLRNLPNNLPRLRPYQIECNAAVEEAIARRKREMLVAMATGTGKTFTLVNQIYRLMKSGVARRVLFLVDRRALAAQAVRAFKSFEPEPAKKFDPIYELYSQRFQREDFGEDEKFDPTLLPNKYLADPKPGCDFVYVCTIQRMAMNLFGPQVATSFAGEAEDESDADRINIPIHAFDFVVADECHRGYTAHEHSVWRDTLNHFDAIKLGLTATPAAHTLALFQGHRLPLRFRARRPRGVFGRLRRGQDREQRPAPGRVSSARGNALLWSTLIAAPSGSTNWKTSGNSTPPKSSGPLRPPTRTARLSRNSNATAWNTNSATAGFPRR